MADSILNIILNYIKKGTGDTEAIKSLDKLNTSYEKIQDSSGNTEKNTLKLSDAFKKSNASITSYISGLENGSYNAYDFGSAMMKAGESAGLSSTQIMQLAEGTGVYTDKELAAASASTLGARKADELAGAVKRGEMTAEQAAEAFRNYSDELQLSTKKSNSMVDSMKSFALQAVGTMVSVTALIGGLKKIGEFIKSSITDTVEYNKQIREMTQVTGLGEEEISRIVQVGDDWGISIEEIRTSLAYMNKSGITPSIDKLAQLADEYVNATNKSAWAEKAVKILGKGYQTLVPLLAQGGDALREATAGIADNMLATDESIEQSREYEVAVDNLTDSWQGFKYTIGNQVIPVLTDLFEAINDQNTAAQTHNEVLLKYRRLMELGVISQEDFVALEKEVSKEFHVGAKETELMSEAVEKYSGILEYSNQAEREETIRRGKLNDVTKESIAIVRDAGTELGGSYYLAHTKVLERLRETKKALDDEADAIAISDEAFGNLLGSLDGPVGQAIEDFNASQGELNAKMRGIKDDIAIAITQGYNPAGEKVMELKGKYDELDYQVKLNAINHQIAMKGMVADMVIAKLSVDGFTDAEKTFITTMLEDLGLADEATYQVLLGSTEIAEYINSGDFKAAGAVLSKMYGDVLGIEGTHNVEINVRVKYGSEGPPVEQPYDINEGVEEIFGNKMQHGGSGIVPPGYNENYPLLLSSGEKYYVEPANQTTTNNFNINLPGSGQASEDITATVRLMELLYG